jgi:hypothetical protein
MAVLGQSSLTAGCLRLPQATAGLITELGPSSVAPLQERNKQAASLVEKHPYWKPAAYSETLYDMHCEGAHM